jgi:cold shock CspA family protein
MSTQEQTTEQTPIIIGSRTGQVKAFNPKKGYGFITVHGETNMDVFVHQTNVNPLLSTYRTLARGEYVSFDVSDDEKKQALNVRGVGGGTLRCDAITSHNSTEDGGNDDNGEFTTVTRTRRDGGGRGRGGRGGGRGGGGRGRAPGSSTLADFVPNATVETPSEN